LAEGSSGDQPRCNAVNDFLVTYLDSIDERLLSYLDDNDALTPDLVKRLHCFAATSWTAL
jgi:hypothetical protein